MTIIHVLPAFLAGQNENSIDEISGITSIPDRILNLRLKTSGL
jgi:hypothetical protein